MRSALALACLLASGLMAALPGTAQGARTIEVMVRDGKVAGSNTVRVARGETAILRWRSDRRLTLHLHGYDAEVTVAPGAPADMTIEARATGRFPVEIHAPGGGGGGHQHKPLFYLEVYPD